MSDPITGAREHIDAARKAAATIADIPADTPLIPITQVGVIGAGTMGGGITMNFLTAGIPVTIVEMTQDALDRGVATIRRNYETTVKKGKLDAAQAETAIALLTPTLDFGALAPCDLVIEAVYESMDVKKEVFGRLDKTVKPGAILASNTSYLDIDAIAAMTTRPASVMGTHFFSPANVMKLLEVVRGRETGASELATVMALSVKIGKIPVVSGVCHGFIGNRMLSPRQAAAHALIMEGAKYWEVDEALLEFGFPMGPWQMSDLAGIDIGWHRDPSRIESIRDALCAVGRWGQKTRKGFYDYDDNRQRTPSDEVKAIIAEFAAKEGKVQRDIGKDEIRERLLYPMISEGALILDEGISQSPGDIDTVWLNGYGWPAWTGGPMFWADAIGLQTVVDGLTRDGQPVAPLLAAKAQAGETFG
ncbi:3-hydroxyacyl-CoA dehydrogenase NAD-binding domain-containing protein [Novosphingobium sp.]|uniref:3-hydroxyacyl-CoA dehydrogenase n=1 Tax=Novosphingobium sp. TaxID=1874826 RepID=UPI003D10A93D